jgi:hypothetical protein
MIEVVVQGSAEEKPKLLKPGLRNKPDKCVLFLIFENQVFMKSMQLDYLSLKPAFTLYI